MERLVMGILAHVDAGKTTLSEALLYHGGVLRRLGRVDHRDAFLDTEEMERQRGITIFAKQAVLPMGQRQVTVVDTPGHVDFSAEAERVLRVLDCAVLVISGTDGVQSHTRTLWQLLQRYEVPTFLFINKMDLAGSDRTAVLEELRQKLSGGCVDFGQSRQLWAEEAAMCHEEALEQYLETGDLSDDGVSRLVARRQLFPCYFGSALKLQGVEALMEGIGRYAPHPSWPQAFGARVFKISRDAQGARLTHLKVTGGTLRVKDVLRRPASGEGTSLWEEKADQLRQYSASKFALLEEAQAGTVVAVTGLSHTFPGQGLGFEKDWSGALLEPVLTYQVELTDGTDPAIALSRLRQVEEEDPQLHVVWEEHLRKIFVQLMGSVQMEILQRMVKERFGMDISFGEGAICYRETITRTVEGIGHFEPLRHYAEVHLLMEPLPRGSGIVLDTACPEDQLDGSYQRLILTHLAEREHPGVLTGSPITDLKITLVAGRAHVKHTEGGDFRQATYRAVRQGLMQGRCVLLEPWYDFCLEVPAPQVGRAMSDLQRMGGKTDPPQTEGEMTVLTGAAPVAFLRSYGQEVSAYTRGLGRLSCTPKGYFPCPETQEDSPAPPRPEIVSLLEGYDPAGDVDNPSSSVFCTHGSGEIVPWDQVPQRAHVPCVLRPRQEDSASPAAPAASGGARPTLGQEQELMAIFERTYGPIKRRDPPPPPRAPRRPLESEGERRSVMAPPAGEEYLLVDGYNIIFAWEELKAIARENLDAARKKLCDDLCNYQGCRGCQVIVVFDAYKVKGGLGSVERYHNICVVYTKEAETADAYIERATYTIGRDHRVKVATSDGPEQLIILGHGALRISASQFREEMDQVLGTMERTLRAHNEKDRQNGALRSAMERAREEQEETT